MDWNTNDTPRYQLGSFAPLLKPFYGDYTFKHPNRSIPTVLFTGVLNPLLRISPPDFDWNADEQLYKFSESFLNDGGVLPKMTYETNGLALFDVRAWRLMQYYKELAIFLYRFDLDLGGANLASLNDSERCSVIGNFIINLTYAECCSGVLGIKFMLIRNIVYNDQEARRLMEYVTMLNPAFASLLDLGDSVSPVYDFVNSLLYHLPHLKTQDVLTRLRGCLLQPESAFIKLRWCLPRIGVERLDDIPNAFHYARFCDMWAPFVGSRFSELSAAFTGKCIIEAESENVISSANTILKLFEESDNHMRTQFASLDSAYSSLALGLGSLQESVPALETRLADSISQLSKKLSDLTDTLSGDSQGVGSFSVKRALLNLADRCSSIEDVLSDGVATLDTKLTAAQDSLTDALSLHDNKLSDCHSSLQQAIQDKNNLITKVADDVSDSCTAVNLLADSCKTLNAATNESVEQTRKMTEGHLEAINASFTQLRDTLTTQFTVCITVLRELEVHLVNTYKDWLQLAQDTASQNLSFDIKIDAHKEVLEQLTHEVERMEVFTNNVSMLFDKINDAINLEMNVVSKLPTMDALDNLLKGRNIALGVDAAAAAVSAAVEAKKAFIDKDQKAF